MSEHRDEMAPPVSGWISPDAVDEAEPSARPPRSARLRSRIAVVTLALAGVSALIASVQDLLGLGVIGRARSSFITDSEAAAFDAGFGTTGVIQSGAYVLAAIAYLAWLSRSVDNVFPLVGRRPIASPRWSIAWWFIPIANLFKPYQIVNNLLRRLAPPGHRSGTIVGVWWVLWLVSTILGQVAGRLWVRAEDLNALEASVFLYLISDVGDIVAAALAIVVVLRIQFWADWRETRWRAEYAPEPAIN